jgi:hypothetical protein
MMNLAGICDAIKTLISDEQIREDFFAHAPSKVDLKEGVYEFELEDKVIRVPLDCELTTIARVIQESYVTEFVEIRVVVAVGGVLEKKCGIVTPKYFEAKLFYNHECALSSIDFYP